MKRHIRKYGYIAAAALAMSVLFAGCGQEKEPDTQLWETISKEENAQNSGTGDIDAARATNGAGIAGSNDGAGATDGAGVKGNTDKNVAGDGDTDNAGAIGTAGSNGAGGTTGNTGDEAAGKMRQIPGIMICILMTAAKRCMFSRILSLATALILPFMRTKLQKYFTAAVQQSPEMIFTG